jgi:hypothetical protein
MSIKHRGGMRHITISSITSENFRSWCCHVGISHHTKHVNVFMNFDRILQKCRIKYYKTLLYFFLFLSTTTRVHKFSKKHRCHFQILCTRQVIWSKSHTKNSQLWRDKWTSLLYGAICSVHVNWYTILVHGVTKLQELCWLYLMPAYKIYLPVWPDPLGLCIPVLVTGHTIMFKCSMT